MTTDLTIGARQQGSADTDGMTYGELVRAVRVLGDAGARSGDQLRATVNRQHRLLTIAASVDPYRPTDPDDPGHDSALDRLTLAIVGLSERVDGLPDQLGYGEVQQGRLGVLTQALQLPPAPADYDDAQAEMARRVALSDDEGDWQRTGEPAPGGGVLLPDPPQHDGSPEQQPYAQPVTGLQVADQIEAEQRAYREQPEAPGEPGAMPGDDLPEPLGRPSGSGQVQRDAEPFTPDGDPS